MSVRPGILSQDSGEDSDNDDEEIAQNIGLGTKPEKIKVDREERFIRKIDFNLGHAHDFLKEVLNANFIVGWRVTKFPTKYFGKAIYITPMRSVTSYLIIFREIFIWWFPNIEIKKLLFKLC